MHECVLFEIYIVNSYCNLARDHQLEKIVYMDFVGFSVHFTMDFSKVSLDFSNFSLDFTLIRYT